MNNKLLLRTAWALTAKSHCLLNCLGTMAWAAGTFARFCAWASSIARFGLFRSSTMAFCGTFARIATTPLWMDCSWILSQRTMNIAMRGGVVVHQEITRAGRGDKLVIHRMKRENFWKKIDYNCERDELVFIIRRVGKIEGCGKIEIMERISLQIKG